MVVDPFFSNDPPKPVRGRRGWWIKRIVLYPLLTLSGCHMLLTGSPVPLWHIERLNNPIAVTTVGDTLVLANGRRVRLPFIKTIPKDDPVFVRALEHGVEVDEKGEVFGLIDPPRMCGNDPVIFYRKRANLSDLAGILNPGGIDDSIVHPDEVRSLKENARWSLDYNEMPYNVMGKLGGMRRVFDHYAD